MSIYLKFLVENGFLAGISLSSFKKTLVLCHIVSVFIKLFNGFLSAKLIHDLKSPVCYKLFSSIVKCFGEFLVSSNDDI